MTEPLLDPEDRAYEEELLRAGREVRMSPAAQAKTLAALGLGTIGVTTAVATKAGATSFWSSKAALFGSIGVVTTGTLAVLLSLPVPEEKVQKSETSPALSSRSKAVASSSDEPAAREAEIEVAAGRTEVPAPTVSAGKTRTARKELEAVVQESTQPVRLETSLGDELAHMGKVESALAAGSPLEALKLLDEYRKIFPSKRLGLEAEIFTIQALHDSGSTSAARARAQKFLERHPSSPLGVKAKQYLK